MYTSYFGFSEQPFSVTPDPRFFYANSVYAKALLDLQAGLQKRLGIQLLTGEVGTGKTTLLKKLMGDLDGSVRPVFFYHTTLTFDELLTFICGDLGLSTNGAPSVEKSRILSDFLIERQKDGSTVALMIDEAQNLEDDALQELLLFSNIEKANQKLLQIILVGQPELEVKLDRPHLHQLKQRIAMHCRLYRLGDREVGPYIDYRLRMVGYSADYDLFTAEAVERIAFYSGAIPRLIHTICDNALLITYVESKKIVSGEIIEEVARDLCLIEDQSDVSEPQSRPPGMASPHESETPRIQLELEKAPRRVRGAWGWVTVGTFLVLPFLAGGAVLIYATQPKALISLGDKARGFAAISGQQFVLVNQSIGAWLDSFQKEVKPSRTRPLLVGPGAPYDKQSSPNNRASLLLTPEQEPIPSGVYENDVHLAALPPTVYEVVYEIYGGYELTPHIEYHNGRSHVILVSSTELREAKTLQTALERRGHYVLVKTTKATNNKVVYQVGILLN